MLEYAQALLRLSSVFQISFINVMECEVGLTIGMCGSYFSKRDPLSIKIPLPQPII